MIDLKLGDMAPDFTLPADGGGTFCLSQHKGKKVILYFYPKDDTSGCTAESCGFRDNMDSLKSANVEIVGLSKDSPASHDKFKAKYDLNFPLASDEKGSVCEQYGVWKEKSMYGKKYMGIERSTFLIDESGKIARIWRNVKVPGHVEEVRQAAEDRAQAA
ncbi:MAG: thioredoxin-dependent thiol peroxidase [Alphaproteobacteria bacterium]|nr:thioredoxin-dependent thiol peroxidase [Alphaproteobacteria bacterium]